MKQWIQCLRHGMHISDDIESLRDVAGRKRDVKANVIEKRVSDGENIFLAWGLACVIGVRGELGAKGASVTCASEAIVLFERKLTF